MARFAGSMQETSCPFPAWRCRGCIAAAVSHKRHLSSKTVQPTTSLISNDMHRLCLGYAHCLSDLSPEGVFSDSLPDHVNKTDMAIIPPVDRASGCGTRACRLSTKQSQWTCANYFLSSSAQREWIAWIASFATNRVDGFRSSIIKQVFQHLNQCIHCLRVSRMPIFWCHYPFLYEGTAI